MPKMYKTSTGTYSEDQLVIAVWVNPKRANKRSQARLLETLTSEKSPIPIAFPLETLQTIESWMYSPVAKSVEDVDKLLVVDKTSREKPLLVPLSIARSYLGWDNFYIPSEYVERR